MIPPTDDYAQRLSAAIPFPKTILGNRQHGAWQRLISVIKSSETLSAFDKAAAYIEGYAHALIDSDQIDISIERDGDCRRMAMRPCWLQHLHLFVATSEYHDFYFSALCRRRTV